MGYYTDYTIEITEQDEPNIAKGADKITLEVEIADKINNL